MQRLEATPLDARVEFRVWAPKASAVAGQLGDATHELAAADGGTFAAEVSARPGDDYVYVLDGSRERGAYMGAFGATGGFGFAVALLPGLAIRDSAGDTAM